MIPTNIITGFLGVGKTTAVLDLLKRRRADQSWAVLVNEYGTVSLDEAFIESETIETGVSVRSVAGGCFCCTTAPMLPVALHFLLQEKKPDRLLIETSGLGHPARLMDTLREHYAERLDVRATIGLVTPADFRASGMIDSNPVFRDQISMSDVLVLNKADRADAQTIADFQTWANELDPPKVLVAATSHGQLDPAWLELTDPTPRGKMLNHTASDISSKGWVFGPEVVFERTRLEQFLRSGSILRLKGIFHTTVGWLAFNRRDNDMTVSSTAYRRDSRVEVFGAPDWTAYEVGLNSTAL
jgi:G3E family GTPase